MTKLEYLKRDIDLEYRAIAMDYISGMDVRRYIRNQVIKVENAKLFDKRTRERLWELVEGLTPTKFFEIGYILAKNLKHETAVLDAEMVEKFAKDYRIKYG